MSAVNSTETVGKYFEDLARGQRFKSGSRAVQLDDIVQFSRLTGDNNPLHVDAAAAAQGPFGAIVAHGALVYSLALGLASQIGEFVAAKPVFREIVNWKFEEPVYVDGEISVNMEIVELKPLRRLGLGKVFIQISVNINDRVTAATGELLLLVPMRPVAKAPQS